MTAPESRRCGNEQMTRRRMTTFVDQVVGVVEIGEELATIFEIDGALLREGQPARRPVQQPRAEPPLERVDPPSDHHRRDLGHECCTRQAAGIDGSDKRLDLLELVHADSIPGVLDRLILGALIVRRIRL